MIVSVIGMDSKASDDSYTRILDPAAVPDLPMCCGMPDWEEGSRSCSVAIQSSYAYARA